MKIAKELFTKKYPDQLLDELLKKLPKLRILRHLTDKVFVIKYKDGSGFDGEEEKIYVMKIIEMLPEQNQHQFKRKQEIIFNIFNKKHQQNKCPYVIGYHKLFFISAEEVIADRTVPVTECHFYGVNIIENFHSVDSSTTSSLSSTTPDLLSHIKSRQLTNFNKFVIFQNVLVALEQLHDQKSPHKNLKSSNILINFNEELNDFGIQLINLLPQDPIHDDLNELKFKDLRDLGKVFMQLFSNKSIEEENNEEIDCFYVDRWIESNFKQQD